MSCFLCEINSEAATSEEENESLNGSLQQGADGEERPHFKNNHISFLFFSTLPVQARIHRLQRTLPSALSRASKSREEAVEEFAQPLSTASPRWLIALVLITSHMQPRSGQRGAKPRRTPPTRR